MIILQGIVTLLILAIWFILATLNQYAKDKVKSSEKVGFDVYNSRLDRWNSLRWTNTPNGLKAAKKALKEAQKNNKITTGLDKF